ncbi:MAG: transcription antitermination factor NusB [Elusimicrobia bacterium]|nr:transcription antitermination factor NusB [Elusimicrobiota bacterium]
MGRRRQGRETALQALYLSDTGRMSVAEAIIIVTAGGPADEKTLVFARELAEGAYARRADLDAHIQDVAQNWSLERMAAVDRNLLRLASFELLHHPQTPVRVVIDEAIEIAKSFSSAESSKFINGILDKIKDRRAADGAPG